MNVGIYIYKALKFRREQVISNLVILIDCKQFQDWLFTNSLTRYTHVDTHRAKSGCMHACLYSGMKVCVYLRVCVLHISQNFIIFSRMQYRYINLLSAWKRYIHLYFYLCMHKVPHSFDHWHCIVFRLYVKLLTSILCNHQKITARIVRDLYETIVFE